MGRKDFTTKAFVAKKRHHKYSLLFVMVVHAVEGRPSRVPGIITNIALRFELMKRASAGGARTPGTGVYWARGLLWKHVYSIHAALTVGHRHVDDVSLEETRLRGGDVELGGQRGRGPLEEFEDSGT